MRSSKALNLFSLSSAVSCGCSRLFFETSASHGSGNSLSGLMLFLTWGEMVMAPSSLIRSHSLRFAPSAMSCHALQTLSNSSYSSLQKSSNERQTQPRANPRSSWIPTDFFFQPPRMHRRCRIARRIWPRSMQSCPPV